MSLLAFVDVASERGAALAEQAWGWMSADERARHDRLVFEHDRRRFRITRALSRQLLAAVTGAAPGALTFARGAEGKPRLVGQDRLDFSVSHAAGLVGCGVAEGMDLGLDLEPTAAVPGVDIGVVAARYFSEGEARVLAALAPEARRARFVWSWTLKEAYVKARGSGLALPLSELDFEGGGGEGPIAIVASAQVPEPAAWAFASSPIGPRHVAALAARDWGGRRAACRASLENALANAGTWT